jgi:hypothetical protein
VRLFVVACLLISGALSACDSPSSDVDAPHRVDKTVDDGEARWSFSSSDEGITAEKAIGDTVVSTFKVERGEAGEVVVTQTTPVTKTVILRQDSGKEQLSVDADFSDLLARAGDLTDATPVRLEKSDNPECGFGRRDSCGLFVRTCQDLLPNGEPCSGWYDCGWCFGIW